MAIPRFSKIPSSLFWSSPFFRVPLHEFPIRLDEFPAPLTEFPALLGYNYNFYLCELSCGTYPQHIYTFKQAKIAIAASLIPGMNFQR